MNNTAGYEGDMLDVWEHHGDNILSGFSLINILKGTIKWPIREVYFKEIKFISW